MRVLHVSDTHLGHAAYHKVSERGLNQREEDILTAFTRVVGKALELRPDVVLHSGDLFDVVRPSNRCLGQAVEQLLRLAKAGIPVVAIAGNHEAPRLRETGSVFRFLEFFDGLRPVYQGKTEVVHVGELAIHAVPQGASQEEVRRQLEEAHPDPGAEFNVLTAHVGVTGIQAFAMGEFNEHIVPTSALDPDFDYVALGHYHGRAQVAPNAWYAGSTERMSFAEAHDPKGFLLADLAAHRVEFHPIAARPMLDLDPIDAEGLDAPALQRAMLQALDRIDPVGKIVRMRVTRVPRHVHAGLDMPRIQRAAKEALHCEVRCEIVRIQGQTEREGAIGPLADEFERFVADVPLDGGLDRARMRAKALGFLQEALR